MTQGAGKIPFIAFDLAGGANLNGSEALIGGQGGQLDFLSVAGYANLGLPGDMVPNAPNPASPTKNWIDTSLGLAWHSDGGMLRGILSRTAVGTRAGVNGAVIPALSENDTMNNPHNPMYGIATTGSNGALLHSHRHRADRLGRQLRGALRHDQSDGAADRGHQAERYHRAGQHRSAGHAVYEPGRCGVGAGVDRAHQRRRQSQPSAASSAKSTCSRADAAIKTAVRCGYVKSAELVDKFGNPSTLDPNLDQHIVGASGIFSQTEYPHNSDYLMTAAVMKMVVNGFAGAGTIELGGFDYHDQARAPPARRATSRPGSRIGACLEYAARVGMPLMIYVFSDGSLIANGMRRQHRRRPRQVHVAGR